MANKRAERERLRREKKAQGLIHIRGWVTPQQAAAIQAIMNNEPVSYRSTDDAVVNGHNHVSLASASAGQSRNGYGPPKLHFEKKPDHPGAWTVWVGRVELGTVYKHIVDENPRPVTVWMAYQPGHRSTRHETRQLAANALLKEYKGPL